MLVKTLIFTVFFMTFFSGLLIKSGMPSHFTILSEFTVLLLLMLSLISRSGKGLPMPEITWVFLIFILITPFSSFLNDTSLLRSIESLRLLFRFYFFYLAIIWLQPDPRFLKSVNIFLAILLLLQFPMIGVKFLQWGIREGTMGEWIRAGHVTAVLWPSCIFYCAAYYYFYKPKNYFIIFAAACVLASIVGAKRLVFFIYPVQFIAIYQYINSKVSNNTFSKRILVISTILVLTVCISGSIMYLNKSLNPANKIGGEIDLHYALEYSKGYLEGVTASGYSFGRLETTNRVFKILYDFGTIHLFFGAGPAVTTPPSFGGKQTKVMFEEQYDKFKINYGFTPMSRIALEYGLLGVFPFAWMVLIFSFRSWRLYSQETDPYWKAFAGGSVGFSFYTVFLFFAYSHGVFWGYTMPALYFYAMAVVSIRYKNHYGAQTKQHGTNIVKYPNGAFAR